MGCWRAWCPVFGGVVAGAGVWAVVWATLRAKSGAAILPRLLCCPGPRGYVSSSANARFAFAKTLRRTIRARGALHPGQACDPVLAAKARRSLGEKGAKAGRDATISELVVSGPCAWRKRLAAWPAWSEAISR